MLMKKIKLFSLVAAALFAGSTMAQTTTIFDASDAGWSATGVDLTTGATTVAMLHGMEEVMQKLLLAPKRLGIM